jgi:hypothetical protein
VERGNSRQSPVSCHQFVTSGTSASLPASLRRGGAVVYNQGVTSNNPTFVRGTVVLVTLRDPREKFWGAVLEITTAGVGVSGITLAAFDDFTSQLRDGEPVSPGVVFFPMHRVERIELDQSNGDIPSLRQTFLARCGCPAEVVLMPGAEREQ